MSKLFTEGGFLSDEGKRVFSEVLDSSVFKLLDGAANESELRLIGSLIQQRVGALVTNTVVAKTQKLAQLRSMSKADWKVYLTEKYGEDYFFKASLTPEEYECLPAPTKEEIDKALEKGSKAAGAFIFGYIDPNMRWR
jgi:replication fork clamp-binding protein CrfC